MIPITCYGFPCLHCDGTGKDDTGADCLWCGGTGEAPEDDVDTDLPDLDLLAGSVPGRDGHLPDCHDPACLFCGEVEVSDYDDEGEDWPRIKGPTPPEGSERLP